MCIYVYNARGFNTMIMDAVFAVCLAVAAAARTCTATDAEAERRANVSEATAESGGASVAKETKGAAIGEAQRAKRGAGRARRSETWTTQ